MNNRDNFFINGIFWGTLFSCAVLFAWGNPLYSTTAFKLDQSTKSKGNMPIQKTLDCKTNEYTQNDVIIFKNNDLFLKSVRLIIPPSEYQRKGGKIIICSRFVNVSSEDAKLNCTFKFSYEKNEFEILPNGSALLNKEIVPREEYMLKRDKMYTCVPDDSIDPNATSSSMSMSDISEFVGNIGCSISIVALVVHLLTFCFLPALRNLAGYNLASLSVAFLLAYSFVLIGQIRKVLGLFCIISGVLQQNFFLAAFFCMNVLAFDVWRTLKLATEKLVLGSQNTRKRQFIWYTLYAWGCPLIISTISIIVDNSKGVPESIKPGYGIDDICWLNNNQAKAIFFAGPAFTLFAINAFFFIRSSWMISSNTMKSTNDQSNQTVRLNYILYVRLGIMMGLTWLIGAIGLISQLEVIWFLFDIVNSLQGLFLFLLFSCTRKVVKHFKSKTSSSKTSSEKQTVSAVSNNFNSKQY